MDEISLILPLWLRSLEELEKVYKNDLRKEKETFRKLKKKNFRKKMRSLVNCSMQPLHLNTLKSFYTCQITILRAFFIA